MNILTKWAVKHLCNQLRRDEGYYISWQANIAMAFVDSHHWAKDKEDIHKIANNASHYFLRNLIGDNPFHQEIK